MTRVGSYRAAFLAGYRAGVEAGRGQANQDWTDLTTAACRAALAGGGIPHAELELRRRAYPTPGLTAAEIRDRARTSWGFVEPVETAVPR